MLWSVGQIANAQKEPTTVPTIFAIGDLHADLDAARTTFRLAGLIDDKDKWIADNVHVVQTGDITDRGPDGLQMLQWFKKLEAESAGHLTLLLGNHETMNLMEIGGMGADDMTSFVENQRESRHSTWWRLERLAHAAPSHHQEGRTPYFCSRWDLTLILPHWGLIKSMLKYTTP